MGTGTVVRLRPDRRASTRTTAGIDRSGRERPFHALDQHLMIDVAMGQQHLDQGPGPCRVAELASGRGPEALVDIG